MEKLRELPFCPNLEKTLCSQLIFLNLFCTCLMLLVGDINIHSFTHSFNQAFSLPPLFGPGNEAKSRLAQLFFRTEFSSSLYAHLYICLIIYHLTQSNWANVEHRGTSVQYTASVVFSEVSHHSRQVAWHVAKQSLSLYPLQKFNSFEKIVAETSLSWVVPYCNLSIYSG